MSRQEAAAKKFGELAGGGPTCDLDFDFSGQIIAAADASDAADNVHRISLQDSSVKRTAERAWEALSKRDGGRSWSQIGERSQHIWAENVRNVLTAAAVEGLADD